MGHWRGRRSAGRGCVEVEKVGLVLLGATSESGLGKLRESKKRTVRTVGEGDAARCDCGPEPLRSGTTPNFSSRSRRSASPGRSLTGGEGNGFDRLPSGLVGVVFEGAGCLPGCQRQEGKGG